MTLVNKGISVMRRFKCFSGYDLDIIKLYNGLFPMMRPVYTDAELTPSAVSWITTVLTNCLDLFLTFSAKLLLSNVISMYITYRMQYISF